MLDDVFMSILDMTKTGSIVILIVILARLLLKRAPKLFSYSLWAVVLLRLLYPISFAETTVSLIPEITPAAETYDLNDEPISVLGAGSAAYQVVGDALNGGLGVQHIHTTEQEPDGTYRTVTTDWYNVWILFGQYVWLAGAAGMLLHSALSYRKLRKQIEIAIPLRDNLYLADNLESPFVVGLIHPKIYLPSNLSQREYDYIILHEQHHIRRGDHIIKALAFLALCLHWFNPLVWLAFHLASKDMEMSCDEAVIRKMGEDIRADYSASLLTLATGRRIIAGTPLAFGEGDPKGRIRNLAKWKKPALWVTIIAAVLCAVLAVCLLTDPMAEEDMGRTYYYGKVVDQGTVFPADDGTERTFITVVCDDNTDRIFWFWNDAEAQTDWVGKTVMVRGSIDADTGISFAYETDEADRVAARDLDEAINAAILDYSWSDRYEGMFSCASFAELARERKTADSVTVYGLAYHQVYRLDGDILVEEGGSHVPVALTFSMADSGDYVLTEYWQPRDGSYYSDDIRAKFPAFVWPDTQEYIQEQIQNCHAQALEHYGIGSDVLVRTLLADICATEQFYDTPESMIYHSGPEVQELIHYSEDTLRYCFAEFLREEQTSLNGEIMALVCQEIMAEMGEALLIDPQPENGQAWFHAFVSNAEALRNQYQADELQTMYPASYLYLKMTGSLPPQQISSSAVANGFEIRLYADRDTYTTDEEIKIWATLEYQGDQETITIWHGCPYITFSITDGADFNTGGMVATILTSTKLSKGEVHKFEYAKSGGYDPAGPDGDFWEKFYQEEALHLPAGTYTVTVNGDFSISPEQRPGEGGPSCELQITVTE